MRQFFNRYVLEVFPARRASAAADWKWPGDEWADDRLRLATWAWLESQMPAHAREIVEIGPGSGKYTEMLLERTEAQVTAYEISDAFIDCLLDRCARFASAGRLSAKQIDWTDNQGLLRSHGDERNVDAVVAIDVLMMMDFQSALVYLVSAAAMLRTGGKLLATFADGGSASGLARMMRDLGRHSATDSSPCTRFHWVTRDMLERVLRSIGFANIEVVEGPAEGLDIARLYIAGELVDPSASREASRRLVPAGGDSSNRLGTLS